MVGEGTSVNIGSFKKTANPEHVLEAKIILSDLLNKNKRKISFGSRAYMRLQVLPPLYDYLAEGEVEKLMEAKEFIDKELERKIHYTKWKEERRQERKIRERNADGSWNSVTKTRFILF